MSPTPHSAFLTIVQPFPHWLPGLSLLNMLTTRPQGHTTLTPAKPQGYTLPSHIWVPRRDPCTLPSLTQPVYRSRTVLHTGNSPSTQHCRGHDRQLDRRALVQVQTQGAAATTVLVASVVKVVWARGSAQALGEAAGEKPCSVLSQMQKCSHSPRMSLEPGAFEAQLIIRGTQCSKSENVLLWCIKAKNTHPPSPESQARFTAAKHLTLQTTQLVVHGW